MRQITCDLMSELEQDRERIAVAGIEAEAPTHVGKLKLRWRSLKALGEIRSSIDSI